MRLDALLDHLRALSPEALAESWDKVGLLVGCDRTVVQRALLCIDLTPAVLEEALRLRAQLIVAYHPVIFEPIASLGVAHWRQRLLRELVRRDLAVYCPHTALDAAAGGMNDFLVGLVGQGAVAAIKPATQTRPTDSLCKIVVFVPESHLDPLRAAMAAAGAGVIGAYRECAFTMRGWGNFRGGAGSNPVIGRRGRLERVEETRLEMVCPRSKVEAVKRAVVAGHPYEEPAYDVYPLLPAADEVARGGVTGQGRIVRLDQPISARTLAHRIRRGLKVRSLQEIHPRRGAIRCVAVCAGAGGSLLEAAVDACDGRLDAFVTGEMRHHDMLDAEQRGLTVLLTGHTQSERPYLPAYRDRLAARTGRAVQWMVSKADVPPGAEGGGIRG